MRLIDADALMTELMDSDLDHLQRDDWKEVIQIVQDAPTIHPEHEEFEWCTDCKEYDQESHCCHRWSKMIRKTVEEMQIVRCKDCIYADYKNVVKALWCSEGGRGKTVDPDDFCSYGERKEDG